MSTWNPNIPQVSDPILQSSNQIRANFQTINSAFNANHTSLTNSATPGQHNLLTLVNQGSDPATSATQIALYNRIVSGIPEVFFRPSSSQTPIQLTYPSLSTVSTGAATNQQYSFVAGPFIIYGGFIKNPTLGQMVTLSPGSTFRSVDLLIVDLSIEPPSGTPIMAVPTSVSGTTFTIQFPSALAKAGVGQFTLYYTVIGT